MRIKITDTTPTTSVLTLVEYSDMFGTALLTKGWA